MTHKDGRTLWRVEVVRVLYVLADDPVLAREMAETELNHHNDAEIDSVDVKKATLEWAIKDGWENHVPYGYGADTVRSIATR